MRAFYWVCWAVGLMLAAWWPAPCRAQLYPWPAKAVPRTITDSIRYLHLQSRIMAASRPAATIAGNRVAVRLAQRLGDQRILSYCWRLLADKYDTDELLSAQYAYEQALAAAQRAQWSQGIGEAYIGLGAKAATGLHDFRRALRLYEQATAQFEKTPTNPVPQDRRAINRLVVLANQCIAYYQLPEPRTALRLCRQALAYRTATVAAARDSAWRQKFLDQSDGLVCLVLSTQANVYDEAHQPDSVRWCVRQGLPMTTNLEAQADFYILLARAELADHHPQAAYPLVRQALGRARAGGYLSTLEDGLKLLPQVLRALRRPEAYDSLQTYVAYQDSANARTRLDAIAEAQAGFDSREQQARIVVLQQRNRLAAQTQELERVRAQRTLIGLAALALLAGGLGGGLFWQYRRRVAQRLATRDAALRQRLAADLHDDVGSLLTQISLQSDLLREAPAAPEATLARLNRLSDTSRRAARQMADVVWGLHASSATLPEVLVHMRDHAHEVLPPASLAVDFAVTDEVAALTPSVVVCQTLYLIYKEALHNAVKHARGATQVTIRLSQQADQLCLRVADNAPGPAPATRPGGRGLANMRQRAEAVGGTLRLSAGVMGFGVEACLPG